MALSREKEQGFHLVGGSADSLGQSRLAQVGGIMPKEVNPLEVRELYVGISRQGMDDSARSSYLLGKYLGLVGTFSRITHERTQQFCQRAESYLGLDSLWYSYGLFAPDYLKALRGQSEGQNSEQHRSLLLGALSRDTVQEYSTVVHTAFPNAVCNVIDLKGEDIKTASPERANFARADALNLPFAHDSLDSIHANQLLWMLRDPRNGNRSLEDMQMQLFREAYRSLRENGILVMVEGIGDGFLERFKKERELKSKLQSAGFSDVTITTARAFKKRCEMDKFFLGTADIPQSGTLRVDPSIAFIVAKKSSKASF